MASYEALEPGGHAHLVGKIKDYANRTSGTGTTQIADGSVTGGKLSDGVQDALDEAALSVDPMLKNGLRGTLPEGTLLTCNDSYAAPAHEVVVFGKSTQAGTPTPSAPVPILSVDALTLHASADGTTDYTNWPVQIPLSNNSLRSLPDGTRDELTLAYEGPSATAGWGMFRKTLTQNTETFTFDGTETWSIASGYIYTTVIANSVKHASSNAVGIRMNCTHGTWASYNNMKSHVGTVSISESGRFYANFDGITTEAQMVTMLQGSPMTLDYPLATPVTHDLGTIELPILPNPMTAWADGGSAQPTISMTYERDVNIARANIISALAEIATS